jgi:hypothetical protein
MASNLFAFASGWAARIQGLARPQDPYSAKGWDEADERHRDPLRMPVPFDFAWAIPANDNDEF